MKKNKILALVNPFFPKSYRRKIKMYLNGCVDFVDVVLKNDCSYSLFFHPDIIGAKCGNFFVYSKNLNEKVLKVFRKLNVPTIEGMSFLRPEYPYDSYYNCFCENGLLVHRVDISDRKIKDYAERRNFRVLNVKQGYTKCSLLHLGNNVFVTDDESIHGVLSENFDVCLVGKGDILLDGYKYGFIGGASAWCEEYVFFFGDAKTHSDYEKIKSFIESLNLKIVSLGTGKLKDYGGIHFFETF